MPRGRLEHRSRWSAALAAAFAALALLAGSRSGAQVQFNETVIVASDPVSKISVEAAGWLGVTKINPAGGSGLLPLTLRVVNGGSRAAVVSVSADRSGWTTGRGMVLPRTEIGVPAGETVSRTVFVDSGTNPDWNTSSPSQSVVMQLNTSTSGQRVDVRIAFNWIYSGAGSATAAVPAPAGAPGAPSQWEATARRVYTAAALAALRSSEAPWPPTSGPAEALVDLAAAPDDWRGYTLLREIVITDDDWTTIPAGTRRALLSWVGLGGLLLVAASDVDGERIDRLGLPRAGADGRRRVGAGEVMPVPRDEATWKALHGFGGAVADARPPAEWAGGAWGSSAFGRLAGLTERTLPFVPILAFLGLFALVAGPLNIMVLAGKGRPARIFWTTPAISLAATAALLGLMFLRDGVGGDGARFTLSLLDPDRNAAYVLQQQMSRTGVLLGSSFPIRETSWMHPEPEDRYVPVSPGMRQGATAYTEVDDTRRSGDWFRSRSDQAFTLQAVRSSRGRLTLSGAAEAPEIVSSIDTTLARLVVVDAAGKAWRCDRLAAGERKALAPATDADLDAVRRELSGNVTPRIAVAVDRLFGAPGHAWAEASSPPEVAIATLDAIRWRHDKAWFVVPLDPGEQP